MMLRKWRELFPNVSVVVKPIILRKKCFHRKAQCHGCQKFGHIVMKYPEKQAPKPREEKVRQGGRRGKGNPADSIVLKKR